MADAGKKLSAETSVKLSLLQRLRVWVAKTHVDFLAFSASVQREGHNLQVAAHGAAEQRAIQAQIRAQTRMSEAQSLAQGADAEAQDYESRSAAITEALAQGGQTHAALETRLNSEYQELASGHEARAGQRRRSIASIRDQLTAAEREHAAASGKEAGARRAKVDANQQALAQSKASVVAQVAKIQKQGVSAAAPAERGGLGK